MDGYHRLDNDFVVLVDCNHDHHHHLLLLLFQHYQNLIQVFPHHQSPILQMFIRIGRYNGLSTKHNKLLFIKVNSINHLLINKNKFQILYHHR